MKLSTKIILSVIFYLFSVLGVSLVIKANIGIDCFYAFITAFSAITFIKIGTISIIINTIFVIIYIVLSKGRNILVYIIQIVSLVVFGSIVNLLLYNILDEVIITSYVLRVFILILGISIAAIAIGAITVMHVITFPIEATCYQIEKQYGVSFIKLRYGIDFFFLIASLSITLIFSTDFYIREGTLIAIVLFSFILNLSKSYMHKHFNLAYSR